MGGGCAAPDSGDGPVTPSEQSVNLHRLTSNQRAVLTLVRSDFAVGKRYVTTDGNEDRTLRSLRRRGLVRLIRDSGPAGWVPTETRS
jgi:hypothetical protein